jgi:hypothetical protein
MIVDTIELRTVKRELLRMRSQVEIGLDLVPAYEDNPPLSSINNNNSHGHYHCRVNRIYHQTTKRRTIGMML